MAEEEEATSADIHALFCHYNTLYFGDALGACVISWSSSPPLDRFTGTCDYHPDSGCEIRISEPLLKSHPSSDLKNALLHEMIHACLFINNKGTDNSDHGSNFKGIMDAIISNFVNDYEKPPDGYNITIYHGLENGVQQSNCGTCVNLTRSDCNEPCGNSSCCAHSHNLILDADHKAAELTGSKDKELNPKDDKQLPSDRYKGLQYRRTKRKSSTLLDNQKANTLTDFFPPEDAACISQGSIPSSDPKQEKKVTGTKNKSHATKAEKPKTVRNVSKGKTQKYSGKKRKSRSTCKKVYNVIIKLYDVYTDEEVEEDLEPLINKRTYRRRKQKLLEDQAYALHARVDNKDDKPPSNSPAMDDIIDISDG